MTTQATVSITLGANLTTFTADIETSYCDGDYNTPSQSVVESIIYFDADGNDANDLINRYESITGVDVSEIALDELT
jgi:hypothetical protein